MKDMRPAPCGQTVCNINHFGNQNRVSQDKASRQVLFYVFFGYSGHALADLASSFTTLQLQHCRFTLLVWQASQAEHLQRLNFAESTCAEDLSVQHVYSLSVYPGLCSHLRTKDSQLTSAREELMDLRFDVELRAASLCRSQATLATEQLNCKWQPLPCTTYVLTYLSI